MRANDKRLRERANWRGCRLPLTMAYILAVVGGGRVKPDSLNSNKPWPLNDWTDEDLKLIVEEGRRQLDTQADRFKHITDRAQRLLTIGLAALTFAAGTFDTASKPEGYLRWISLGAWGLGATLLIIGVGAALATMVTRGTFGSIDATRLTAQEPKTSSRLHGLATDYSRAVVIGETTVAAYITVFGNAARFISWGTVATALAWLLGLTLT